MRKYYEELTGNETKEPIFVDSKKFYGEGYEDSERRYPDLTKIQRLTGWSAKYNLRDTFKNTVLNAINYF